MVIHNGSLALTGRDYAAGIGSAFSDKGASVSLRTILIQNGSFGITAGDQATGIGAGLAQAAQSVVGNIIIEDGSFDVTGGEWAAGLGTAGAILNGNSYVGQITIEGGNGSIRAKRGGAGIGTGDTWEQSTSSVEGILISNGRWTVSGGEMGAGIGAGRATQSSNVTIGSILIENGSLTIVGGSSAAGIGLGYALTHARSSIGEILVKNGSLTITGDQFGSGIGGGQSFNHSHSQISLIDIEDGKFSINGDLNVTGIGFGFVDQTSSSKINTIRVQAGTIRVTGGIAVGSHDGRLDLVAIGGSSSYLSLDCISLNASSCLDADSVHFVSSSAIHVRTQTSRFLTFSQLAMDDSCDVLVEYRVESERENLAAPSIHYGSLAHEFSGPITIRFHASSSGSNASPVREVIFDSSSFVGFMVSLPPGLYFVTVPGHLDCQPSTFAVTIVESFHPTGVFCVARTALPTEPFTDGLEAGRIRLLLVRFLAYTIALPG
jgi:hypothetical protein